jgi:hypothetical protein
LRGTAQTYFDKQSFTDARDSYQQLTRLCGEIQALDSARHKAADALKSWQNSATSATQADTGTTPAEPWIQAQPLAAQAQVKFDAADFADAQSLWEKAAQLANEEANRDIILYDTHFEAPAFHPGPLVGQDGWIKDGNPPNDAGQIVSADAAQCLSITGQGLKNVGFFKPISYDPLQSRHTKISVSADVLFKPGPNASKARFLFAFLVPNDADRHAFVSISPNTGGAERAEGAWGQNWGQPNHVVSAKTSDLKITGANASHNLRVDLDFTGRKAHFFLDGTEFGTTAFQPQSGAAFGYMSISMQSSDPIDSTLLIYGLNVKAISG